MAGPCVMDGDCTSFYMDGDNLRVDVVVDPDDANCLSCGLDGLFVPCHRMRFVNAISNTPVAGIDGLTAAFGGIRIGVEDFGNDIDNGAGPVEITTTTTTSYQNTTDLTEIVQFEYVLGQTIMSLRGGWDFKVGLKTTWFGLAGITPVTSYRSSVGLNTGQSYVDLAVGGVSFVEPMGVTHPPLYFQQNSEIAPGETLTLQFRMWAEFVAKGFPDDGGMLGQSIYTSFGSAAHIRAWTKG